MVAVACTSKCRIVYFLQTLVVPLLLWSSCGSLPRTLAFLPSKGIVSSSSLGMWNMLNIIFPEEEMISDVDPHQVLASFDLPTFSDPEELTKSYDSLTNYLQLWGRNLELQPDKGLTTPITATDFRSIPYSYAFLDGSLSSSAALDAEPVLDEETDTVVVPRRTEIPTNVSMTLKFRPPKRYLSYKEQKSMEKGVLPDRKGAKVDAWSPGGILLSVQVMNLHEAPSESRNDEPIWKLMLQARRCDIDGDTVIKYSSERAIVRRLKEAVRIWLKVRSMP